MSFSEWREIKLGDIAKYSKVRIKADELTLYNYVSTENMLPQKSGKTIASSLPSGSVVKFKYGQTLISNIRPYFKKIWYANIDGGCSADVLSFDIKDGVNAKYFYYLLSQDVFFDYVMAGSKGTKMPRGDKQQIMMYSLQLPPLYEQKAIADTLSCLDDKIELNNKINDNLQQQAQAIFKSWFIDFEPFQDGNFIETALGSIPEGWHVLELDQISKEIVCGKTPSTKRSEYYGSDIPFITIPDMHSNTFVVQTERCLSVEGALSQSTKSLPPLSVCVSCIATAGLVSLVAVESQTNQQINSIIPLEDISPFYVYLLMKSLSDHIQMLGSSGSTTCNLNKGQFSKIKIIVPCSEELMKFHKIVSPMFEMIKQKQYESITLAFSRDTLIPRLMSGEIDVSNITI